MTEFTNANGSCLLTRGDIQEATDVLSFLFNSAANSISWVSLSQVDADAAATLRQAASEDGIDLDSLPQLQVGLLDMASGRISRHLYYIFLWRNPQIPSRSIQYLVEKSSLVGRIYNDNAPGVILLSHEIRTDNANPVYVTGSSSYLGQWDPDQALPLESTGAGRGGYHWEIDLPVPPGASIEFKFLQSVVRWESGSNRQFTASDQNVTISDNFRE